VRRRDTCVPHPHTCLSHVLAFNIYVKYGPHSHTCPDSQERTCEGGTYILHTPAPHTCLHIIYMCHMSLIRTCALIHKSTEEHICRVVCCSVLQCVAVCCSVLQCVPYSHTCRDAQEFFPLSFFLCVDVSDSQEH